MNIISIQTTELCHYGCGNIATHKTKTNLICQSHYNKCPANRKKNSDSCLRSEKHKISGKLGSIKAKESLYYISCEYCKFQCSNIRYKQHKLKCYLNPTNIKLCEICNTPIKEYKKNTTCSRGCANTKFRSRENHPSWNGDSYRVICFQHHKSECVVCKEQLVVEVHHLDENHENNNPSNLIPLCPTHHRYIHSIHKHIVDAIVLEYIKNWSSNPELNRLPGVTRANIIH